jgi:two-component system, sensor histidine kinase and response regulator
MKDRVLYVDDEIENLKALKRVFQREPLEFLTYDSPIKALNEIDHINPAVVIADQCMPEMSGAEFLEGIASRQPTTVRMILTGQGDFESAVEAINKGHVYCYIEKPWNEDDLKTKVKSALEHQESIVGLHSIVDILADEIIENQKDHTAIQKLAGAVSDDLSQPLMIIAGYAKLLQNCLQGDEIPTHYLSNILLQVHRMEELQKKIKSISRRLCISHGHLSWKVVNALGSAESDPAKN